MAKNKIVYGNETLIDLTDATATASDVASGKTAYGASGEKITGTAVLPSGTVYISSNGTYDVAKYASAQVDVPSSDYNVQVYAGMGSARTTTYSATGVKLTVKKTGTYQVSWFGCRNTNSGTNGSQIYVNSVAKGSAHTSFTNTYAQSCIESNISLNEGDEIEVRARARSTSYYMMVGQLAIVENGATGSEVNLVATDEMEEPDGN